jgi:2-polyprenyl-3-methyl-5-hydroxy-6-metoxy-1,4-benzoquinol methylase
MGLVARIPPKKLKHEMARLGTGWEMPGVPDIQWIEAVKPTIDNLAKGIYCPAFCAFRNLLTEGQRAHPLPFYRVLDVGASSAYYRDVMERIGFPFQYTGFDISPAFAEFARRRVPGIAYDVGDIRATAYKPGSFDLVVEGSVLIHLPEWEKAVAECARISAKLVMFHRTPIIPAADDEYWEATAYGTSFVRVHLSRMRFEAACARVNLKRIASESLGEIEGGAIMESSMWVKHG